RTAPASGAELTLRLSPVPARRRVRSLCRRVRSLCRRVRIVRCEHNRVACGHGFPRAFFELLGGVGRSSFGFMALSVEERERFLAAPRVGALSVVDDPARAPLTIPIWYQYIPKGELWVRTGPASRKVRAIEAAGRFSLMVQRTEPTVRYVSVEGRSEEHTSELQSRENLVCRLLLEKKKKNLKSINVR